jgi:hypothetical protein
VWARGAPPRTAQADSAGRYRTVPGCRNARYSPANRVRTTPRTTFYGTTEPTPKTPTTRAVPTSQEQSCGVPSPNTAPADCLNAASTDLEPLRQLPRGRALAIGRDQARYVSLAQSITDPPDTRRALRTDTQPRLGSAHIRAPQTLYYADQLKQEVRSFRVSPQEAHQPRRPVDA